jgi:hypothetical protein
MLMSIIFIPLLNFIFFSGFGRFLGSKGVSLLAAVTMSFCTLSSYFAFYNVLVHGFTYFTLGS